MRKLLVSCCASLLALAVGISSALLPQPVDASNRFNRAIKRSAVVIVVAPNGRLRVFDRQRRAAERCTIPSEISADGDEEVVILSDGDDRRTPVCRGLQDATVALIKNITVLRTEINPTCFIVHDARNQARQICYRRIARKRR
jgi:hypothetical protein